MRSHGPMAEYPKLAAVVLLLASLIVGSDPVQAQFQNVVFATPINLVTVPTSSQPIRNIGQAMHLLLVTFHFGADPPAPVSGFDVTLEWSRDGVNWRPAGPSVTSAPLLNYGDAANDVVAYMTYYGAFRAIRVTSNYTGAYPLDVYYTGQIVPVDPFVTLTNNRWVF
jgi:hypothetical protein